MRQPIMAATCALAFCAIHARADGGEPYLTQPALSPDGREIAFASGGDLWAAPAAGGAAHLLVSGDATEARPIYSPDGLRLAFESTRTGNGDIYLLDLGSGTLTRLTHDDGYEHLDAWSHDGAWIYFSASTGNVGRMDAIYRVRADGGTPMPVSREDYRVEQDGAPSPDGKDLALVAGGFGGGQWWRNGQSHIDTGAIWLLRDDGSHAYRRLTPDDARAQWPMWNADGSAVYYMSDRDGHENIWRAVREGDPVQVSHFTNGRVTWPSISADGGTVVFERDFGLWSLDTKTGVAHALPITLRGAAAAAATRHETFKSGYGELALSPDGKKIAFVVHGEVFAAAADKGGAADRVTDTPSAEYQIAWAPDSRRLIYGSERDGTDHLFLYDFATHGEKRLTNSDGDDTRPLFSPDGKRIAFLRGGRMLYVIDADGGHEHRLAEGIIDAPRPLDEQDRAFAWSPDSRWIAYLDSGDRLFRNANVVAVDGGKSRPVSFLANVFADSIAWTPDGRALMFITGQRTEQSQVARVDLLPHTPVFREDEFRNLFQEQTPPGRPGRETTDHAGKTEAGREKHGESEDKSKSEKPPAPVRIDFDGIRERLSLLPVGIDVNALAISPDGKSLLLTAQAAGRANLYVYSIDELAGEPAVARQLTSTAGPKLAAQFSPDGKTAYYLDGGSVFSSAIADGKPKAIATSAEMDIDFDAEKRVVFDEVWRWQRANFHDPKMNGADWNALRERYRPRVEGARTPDELRVLMNLLVGELNASHSGVRAGGSPPTTTGHVGLAFDRGEYEQHGRLRVSAITPLSPAAVAGGIAVGDYLLAVDGSSLSARSDLAALLDHRIGRETTLKIAASTDGHDAHDVKVKPIGARDESALAYRAWVERNREYVARASNGRLGYVHMADMSENSLQCLYLDLDAENSRREGVVVDERNNYGGFVNAYALDVLSRRHYLTMTFRGADPAPARSVLGQRALERPTVLITNRVTLSDGEDFSEGYRALGLGKIVGEPTAGWIIYTSNEPLIDGSSVRLPAITITTAAGEPMEMHPRPVDVPVTRPLGESYRSVDSDLDAAVRTLLADPALAARH